MKLETMSERSEQPPVRSLGRVLDVLELFGAPSSLSVSEVAQQLGWPVPTAHRAIATLIDHEFLVRDPDTKRLRLGFGVLRLVAPLLAGFTLPELARPHLRVLAEDTGETTSVAVLDGAEVLYLVSHPGTFRLRVDATPGLRLPAAHCTALGKCLLAQLDPDDARRRLGSEPYTAFTRQSARTWAELAPALDAARARGYAISVNEYEEGLLGCAVPIHTRDGVIAGVNVAVSAARVSPEQLVDVILPKLKATAGAIDHAEAAGAGGA